MAGRDSTVHESDRPLLEHALPEMAKQLVETTLAGIAAYKSPLIRIRNSHAILASKSQVIAEGRMR
jgi:hypothetical protein